MHALSNGIQNSSRLAFPNGVVTSANCGIPIKITTPMSALRQYGQKRFVLGDMRTSGVTEIEHRRIMSHRLRCSFAVLAQNKCGGNTCAATLSKGCATLLEATALLSALADRLSSGRLIYSSR